MITFMESKDKLKETDKCLDSQLWHACAGSMVQMPPVNSKVFYFPQGHAEHASGNVDFRNLPRVPAYVPCRVAAVKFMADPDSDEVYAKIRLIPIPLSGNEFSFDDEEIVGMNGMEGQDKPTSFAKTLTQSDANNGGGFSVPRYCAETIFPRLDYSADPPVQTILAKDVHGEIWKFRHIYRGTPRRHLLTTGWSTFVNHKKLIAGDSIVFLRAENGDLCVGIRRAKRGIVGGLELASGWNPAGGNREVPYGGFSTFTKEDESKFVRNSNGKGRVSAESVAEAATLAAKGQPFEVIYYPRASTPEFCVKASLVKTALQIRWSPGMRFKMPFETEDSSRISWFMGTISSVQVADPIRWPDSPWRLLQVTWDEPDLLQNVKRVSPWLVELASNMPAIHLSPFSPPRKKMRLPQHPDFPLENTQLPMPTFCGSTFLGLPTSPFGCIRENSHTPAGMQGARHAPYGISLADIHLSKLESGFFPTRPSNVNLIINKPSCGENVSCLLTMGNSTTHSKKPEHEPPAQFLLFGKPILTERQISESFSVTGASSSGMSSAPNQTPQAELSCSDKTELGNDKHPESVANLETAHCKVFMKSQDVGQTLDLSLHASYEDLYRKLADMFNLEISDITNHVQYWDASGCAKQIGDEPFSNFVKTARRLTILSDASSNTNNQDSA